MFPWSMASTIEPPVGRLRVRAVAFYPGASGRGRPPANDIQSAVTTRRAAPLMRTLKSSGARPRTGRPSRSTTVTSMGTTSTPDRNRGGVLSGRRLAGSRPWSQQRRTPEERRQRCRELAVHRSDAAGIRYAVRARTPDMALDFHLDASQRAITFRIRRGVAERGTDWRAPRGAP